MSAEVAITVAAILGYLLGSIPFGLLLTRAAGLGDIRSIGSGSIGTTNVLRTGNKKLAAGTLLLDAGKAALAVLLARWFLGETPAIVAAICAFVGHCFPVWLRFKGGKGVATYIGALLVLAWPVGLAFCAIWLLVAFTLRISSAAALVAAAIVPLVALWLVGPPLGLAALILSVLLYVQHRSNIGRLLNGTESRIGAKSTHGTAA